MKYCLLFIVINIFYSCGKKDKIPEDILSKEKMEELLLDLARADQYVSGFRAKDTSFDMKAETIKFYQRVFKLHNTDKQIFQKSLGYYKSRPDILKIVFDTLNVRQQRLQSAPYNNYGQDTSKGKRPPILQDTLAQ